MSKVAIITGTFAVDERAFSLLGRLTELDSDYQSGVGMVYSLPVPRKNIEVKIVEFDFLVDAMVGKQATTVESVDRGRLDDTPF